MSTHKPPDEPVSEAMGFSSARRLIGALLKDEAVAAGLPHLEGYVLSRQLGRGGGGVVYLGHRSGSDRRLAIKLLEKPLNGGPGAERAWRELDVLTQLRLSCTPRVHDYGVHEGRMYIATEHVDGLSLVEHCRANDLSRRQQVALLARVAEAVAAIHERGVIHRDLKPDNVLIDSGGQPVIIDLGIAFLLSADLTETLTAEGVSIGTPAFMSPEQARGEREAISTRSDIYSLGATACRVLTGRTPHDLGSASLLEAIQKVGHQRPRDPRTLDVDLPEPLAAILSKALAPRPEDRFASATELADDLRRWLENKPTLSQPPSWWRNQWLSIQRHPARWAWGTAASIVIFGLTVLSAVSTVQAAEAQAAQEWNEKYEEVIGNASLAFAAQLRNADFDEALATMKILEAHVNEGFFVFENGEELLEQTRQHRNVLTVETLEVIHAADSRGLTKLQLAMAAVQAVYEDAGAWDEALGARIEQLLLEHETSAE